MKKVNMISKDVAQKLGSRSLIESFLPALALNMPSGVFNFIEFDSK